LRLQLESSLYVSDNSKECDSNTLFLQTTNSSKYCEDAIKNGAKGVITPRELRGYVDIGTIRVVGVTGTNGKTTTTALIYSLLLDLGYKCALSGTRGFFINDTRVEEKSLTTVDVLSNFGRILEAKKNGCEFYITEVSSHALDQDRLEGIDFDLKVLTNITSDHLDYHKTIENYIATKNSFFADESPKLINKDEKKAIFNIKNSYTYSIEESASFMIKAYSLTPKLSGVIEYGTTSAVFESDMLGKFNLYNILAAIASVSILTDRKLEDICEALESFGGVEGRLEIVNEDPLVVVDFAHTEDGMKQVLESFPGVDVSVVFGAGGDRDSSKRKKMGEVANRYAKKIYITNDNPRSEEPENIADDIAVGIVAKERLKVILDRREAIFCALNELVKGEVLLILGKGDEEYMEIKGIKTPFKDREAVKDYFRTRT